MWHDLWQGLAVGIIVAMAVLYIGAKYLPASWRRAIVHRLSQGGHQSKLVQWLDTSASCGGGCNSCSGGNGCGPAEPAPAPGKGKVIPIHERR